VWSSSDPSIVFPTSITTGPDGALWFTNTGNDTIGRITTDGIVTSYGGPVTYPTHATITAAAGSLPS